MNCMLLIYFDFADHPTISADEDQKLRARYDALTEDVAKSGHLRSTASLKLPSSARTVRIRRGEGICRVHSWNSAAVEVRPVMAVA